MRYFYKIITIDFNEKLLTKYNYRFLVYNTYEVKSYCFLFFIWRFLVYIEAWSSEPACQYTHCKDCVLLCAFQIMFLHTTHNNGGDIEP